MAHALAPLGWDGQTAAAFAEHTGGASVAGRVLRADRGWCTVAATPSDPDDGPLEDVRARLAADVARASDGRVPAVGDWVGLEHHADGTWSVRVVLPRRSAFIRQAAGDAAAEQVVAANVDVVFCVTSLASDVNVRRLERYLALAHASGAEPVVVLTKPDRCDDPAAAVAAVMAAAPQVPVHVVNGRTGEGLDALEAHVRPHGRVPTVALLGQSGVGKSTITNRLVGSAVMATGDVRRDDKGRHTTTHRQLVVLPAGGVLIDTPGMRGLGLWEADSGVEEVFSDVEELAAACRFADCVHATEPGCAIRGAVEEGVLDVARVLAWLKLQRELAEQASRRKGREGIEAQRRAAELARTEAAYAGAGDVGPPGGAPLLPPLP